MGEIRCLLEDPGLFDKYESADYVVNKPKPSNIIQIDLFENPIQEIRVANSLPLRKSS